MKISRAKFVTFFVISAFALVVASHLILNQPAEWVAATKTQATWQLVISTILTPVRFILMRPLVPFIDFLRQDPDTPPPFFVIGFAMYWTLLGIVLYDIIRRAKRTKAISA